MKTLRLGTRKSALAQVQARWVATRLQETNPGLHVELDLITTTGDRDSSEGARVRESGGLKALFTKEIEEALLDKRIDLAVHSLKDMAADLPKGLVIGAVPEREDPRDAWISKNKTLFKKLAHGATVGTGAVRRQAQLKHVRADLVIVPLRGNVDTRLRKLADGTMDGIILAMAGLKRLGLSKEVTEVLAPDILLPAVGQGCLAIEVRQADRDIATYLKPLDHSASHQAALAERAFLKALGGSCQTPIAGFAELVSGQIVMKGLVISHDGLQVIAAKETGRPFDASGVGERLAAQLLAAGADKILQL